ncbi:MAG: radical SAM protein [Acidobacteria bacterium]|nr:radical SAM protein [Acidobacteriota bacterium]
MRLLPIQDTQARRILSPVSGFLAEAGFTHSLTPARNCTYGCSYCYVPTMRIQAGLKPDDWKHWGEYTTYKTNAPALLKRELKPDQLIYCSPLTDPYQPAEMHQEMMPQILEQIYIHPPKLFVIQTRSPNILRDTKLLQTVAENTDLRISFSITTNDDRIRKIFEPRCESIPDRLRTIEELRAAGLNVYATVAPILPCEPPELARLVVEATSNPIIGDPLHIRQLKPKGATTRDAAFKILDHYEQPQWAEPEFQTRLLEVLDHEIRALGRDFATGPKGFSCLTQTPSSPAWASPAPPVRKSSRRSTRPPASR